jgi:hypothetical protein
MGAKSSACDAKKRGDRLARDVAQQRPRPVLPGGRLQTADILLHDDVTPQEVAQKGEWSD